MKGKMNTDTTFVQGHTLGRFLLRNYAGSFLVFSIAFFVVLLLSLLILLPRITSFRVGGSILPGGDLHAQWRSLHEEVESLEHVRDAHVLSLQDALYVFLREHKHEQGSLRMIAGNIQQVRARLSQGQDDAISIDRMVFDRVQEPILRLEGKVQHSGPRSMTLLVAFVEALEQLPSFSVSEQPHFTRVQDAIGEFISPFSFVISVPRVETNDVTRSL